VAQRVINRRRTSEGRRRETLARKYGITPHGWDALFTRQKWGCAICGAEEPGRNRNWHTDHSHHTGLVRGILCAGCNVGLGHFRDDPTLLMAAASYVAARS